jgi:hypothetical protein
MGRVGERCAWSWPGGRHPLALNDGVRSVSGASRGRSGTPLQLLCDRRLIVTPCDDTSSPLRVLALRPLDPPGFDGRSVGGPGAANRAAPLVPSDHCSVHLHHICTTSVGQEGPSAVNNGHAETGSDLRVCLNLQVDVVDRAALIMLSSVIRFHLRSS